MADDKSIGSLPIPDHDRRKFYDDGDVSYVRVVPFEEEITNVTNEQLILNTLQKLLKQAQLTNLYLEQIVGDNLGDGCG
jgi:hypothetical protein